MLPFDYGLWKLMAIFGTNICNLWGKNAQTYNIIANNGTCGWIEKKNAVSSMPMWNSSYRMPLKKSYIILRLKQTVKHINKQEISPSGRRESMAKDKKILWIARWRRVHKLEINDEMKTCFYMTLLSTFEAEFILCSVGSNSKAINWDMTPDDFCFNFLLLHALTVTYPL